MNEWQHDLERTGSCIPLERFGETLTAAERAHIRTCVRCEAELRVWQEINAAEPSPGEEAAVRWIAAETARRTKAANGDRKALPERGGLWTHRPAALALAATLALAAVFGGVVWERRALAPGGPPASTPIYRSVAIEDLRPRGDVDATPAEFTWHDIAGADRYDVELREVDDTVVWQASTRVDHVELPAAARSQLSPGRTLRWRVTAHAADGTVIGVSELVDIRVRVSERG